MEKTSVAHSATMRIDRIQYEGSSLPQYGAFSAALCVYRCKLSTSECIDE